MTYIPYGDKNNIANTHLRELLNYLERHAKVFKAIPSDFFTRESYQVDEHIYHIIGKEEEFSVKVVDKDQNMIALAPLEIFTNTVASFYSWLKKKKK